MKKKRKIAVVARCLSLEEAEEADDEYWAMTTVEQRLQELIELRRMIFGENNTKIKKVVSRRSIYEAES